jgi:hypothetical protein
MNAPLTIPALPPALIAALDGLTSEQWFAGDAPVTCSCDAPCATEDGQEYWALAGAPCCGLQCVAYRMLWAHHPAQDQSDAAVDLVLAAIAERIVEQLRAAEGGE